MSILASVCLARADDAREIAELSRDHIESGLGWSWTPARVRHSIRIKDTTVVVARRVECIAAFAIMHIGEDVAHLNLLAVAPAHRREGLGRRLIDWLVVTSTTAGVFRIDLELRAANDAARAFYEAMGFRRVGIVAGYYQGRESALRMTRDLSRRAPPVGL